MAKLEIRDRIKELRRVRAGDLAPNPKNWRTHPVGQRKALESLLTQVGYAEALVAYEAADGLLTLVDGHLRQSLDPEAVVPVLVLDVDEAEADLLLATLDPIAELARADSAKLIELQGRLPAVGPEVEALLADLRDRWEETGAAVRGSDPDAPAPEGLAPVAKLGDVWQLGPHRLMCGDSTNGADVATLLDRARPWLMVTDPPYGVEYEADWRHASGLNNSPQTGRVLNDGRASWAGAWNHFTGDVAYVWHASRFGSEVERSLAVCSFEVRAQIIWVKNRLAISRGAYHWRHEPCFYAVRAGATARWAGGRKQDTVWASLTDVLAAQEEKLFAVAIDETTVCAFPASATTVWEMSQDRASGGGHSTQKPVEAMARPMRNHGAKGDVVYDPFCGSGTALIAAEVEGRVCYAMELNPAYVDAAVARWTKFTNQAAILRS